MSAREILAYAITHAPRGQKGGPYEGGGPPGDKVASMALAMRYAPADANVCREDAAYVTRNGHDVRVIRIVRKARLEVGAAKESAAFEAETWREASAVEVLRELVAWSDNEDADTDDVIRIATKARRVLAASGPDPSEVVRAAMAELEAWDAYLAAPATRSRAETEALDKASKKRFAAVDAYRKAGGK